MPMILIGVFSFASSRSCEMSCLVQGLPIFLVPLVISVSARTIITKHLLEEVIRVDMPASVPLTAFGILNSVHKPVPLWRCRELES
jgi:hypothetical protein